MKLFLGVAIPDDSVKQIDESIKELKKDYPEFLWIREKNYHLTIFFFGERSESKLPNMIEGIEQTVFDIKQSQLSTFGVKMFVQKGITIHMAFNRNRELELIHDRIISEIGSQIPQKHHTYIPHITLAQHKLPSKQQYFLLKKRIEKIQCDIEFRLDTVHLYQSIIKKPFPEYRILHTFYLQRT